MSHRLHTFVTILTVLAIHFSAMALPPPPATAYYSRADGVFEAAGTWSSTSHDGASNNTHPTCAMSGNIDIYVADSIISACDPMIITGNVNFIISEGGYLDLQGGLEIYGNAQFQIAEGAALNVIGDLEVAGSGELVLDGFLSVTGDVNLSGGGEICGTGNAEIGGSISGDGWCLDINVLPIQLISFNAALSGVQQVILQWSTALEINNDYFLIERSDNGMSFYEIGRVEGAGNSSFTKQYSFEDVQLSPGTYYYRLTQVDYDGDSEAFEIIAVTIKDGDESNLCELQVYPNPCDPSCSVTLSDCLGNTFRTYLMDGAGRTISELIPINKSNTGRRIDYKINKENFMMPGIYIIHSRSEATEVTKKLIIK